MSDRGARQAVLLAAAGVLLTVLCQWATVHANYGGSWNALYWTGALERHPPLVSSEQVYLSAKSDGYDGQFYHYMAHDPFLRTTLSGYVDDPRFRYRRILIPLLAYVLALGQSQWVDPAFEIVILACIGLGVYWSAGVARQADLPPAWGLLFLLLPATIISADRLVTDVALAALAAAFICYLESPGKLFLVLACAPLVRETGWILITAYVACLLWQKHLKQVCLFLLSAIPAAAWYTYVGSRTSGATLAFSLSPFSAIVSVFAHPWEYPPGTPLAAAVRAADYLALSGLLVAFGLAILWFVRKPADPRTVAAFLFAGMGMVLGIAGTLLNVYHFGRIYTPLVVMLTAVAAQHRKPWMLAPLAMMLPRIAMELTPQLLGILHWVA